MTHEEFTKLLSEVPDEKLIKDAEKHLQELLDTGGRSYTLNVPPQVTDIGMVFTELIERFKRQRSINRITELIERFERQRPINRNKLEV